MTFRRPLKGDLNDLWLLFAFWQRPDRCCRDGLVVR